MDANENTLQLLQSWRETQLQISSSVIIPHDNSSKLSCQGNTSCGRFRLVHPPPLLSIDNSPLLIGGLDTSYFNKHGSSTTDDENAIAVYVILKYYDDTSASTSTSSSTSSSLPQVVHRSHKCFTAPIPYIPSFLAFREVDPMLELISSQIQSYPELKPHVLLVDGNGQWHERKAGIASFVGVKTGIPTIGVGKSFYSMDGGCTMKKEDVLRNVRMAVQDWYDTMVVCTGGEEEGKDGHENNIIVDTTTLLPKIMWTTRSSRQQQQTNILIVDTVIIPTTDSSANNEGTSTQDIPVNDIVWTSLSQFANGFAIPMKGGAMINSSNNSEEILAYALVGHGGKAFKVFKHNQRQQRQQQHAATTTTEPSVSRGSKTPIYISVGSHIALVDAVALCSQLCITRIPEPIREADLYGRKLVRERLLQQQKPP